ncbi:enolase C-terminal domain-like protein [Lutibaculum baratangense]|uniref:Chloromuconate cycloisomerase n=1 Tax=Lutibaculum baratangense AMV1 TaxID=631454 RepID=V4RA09_9HYPH|nr:enolase C-terminal domain-like protein [Lutibaculum baratangense]ESR23001.1 chloromuconate cycloisomerase [Lutibaculum baratangense AMV1]
MASSAPIVSVELHELEIPYRRPVEWTVGGTESGAAYLVLRLVDEEGAAGAAESLCKPIWNGVTPGILARLVSDVAWPAMRRAGLPDEHAGRRIARNIRDVLAVQALLDNACRDLCAARTGADPAPPGPVAATPVLTRAAASVMAEEARGAVDRGFVMLKVKLGQGLREDAGVLAAIRGAVGGAVALTADANGAYARQDLPELMRIVADADVAFLEDPCPIVPREAWRDVFEGAPVPVMLDRHCSSADAAGAFADFGATHFAAKPGRLGLGEAEAIADCARAAGGGVCVGMFSESALGAVNQIRFAGQLAGDPVLVSAETAFHEGLAVSYLEAPLGFVDGGHVLPPAPNLDALVDWERLRADATTSRLLGG